jgi:hypothetical protein
LIHDEEHIREKKVIDPKSDTEANLLEEGSQQVEQVVICIVLATVLYNTAFHVLTDTEFFILLP